MSFDTGGYEKNLPKILELEGELEIRFSDSIKKSGGEKLMYILHVCYLLLACSLRSHCRNFSLRLDGVLACTMYGEPEMRSYILECLHPVLQIRAYSSIFNSKPKPDPIS